MIGKFRVLYDEADLAKAAALAIREVDGRLSPEEGRRIAIAVLDSIGMESSRAEPAANNLPEVRG